MITRIVELLVEPSSSEDDNVYSYENCISSLGKICYYHYDGVTVNKNTVQMFLEMLPLQVDDEEARPTNKLFFEMVLAKNQALMQHTKLVKETLLEIKQYQEEQPDLITIDEEGLVLLEKALKEKF